MIYVSSFGYIYYEKGFFVSNKTNKMFHINRIYNIHYWLMEYVITNHNTPFSNIYNYNQVLMAYSVFFINFKV